MLAPGDAAVLAHILRTDPHLHPPRHPDRLTTNTYLGPARSVGVTTDSHFSRGAIPISLNRQPRLTSNPQAPPHLTPSITQRPRRLRHRATRRKHHHRLRQLTTTGSRA